MHRLPRDQKGRAPKPQCTGCPEIRRAEPRSHNAQAAPRSEGQSPEALMHRPPTDQKDRALKPDAQAAQRSEGQSPEALMHRLPRDQKGRAPKP
ncbi:hypothetical protein NDU88_011137 [Pleurodeles waltl]|uniref:Uncharacterized protein n=1 Tax=Pleurodeles waltl TaxID=8319 RepID=A0AAV7PZX2_PLEWA|nr:hypothetical protein NDU88_011137 [Pleurodeles waltl]